MRLTPQRGKNTDGGGNAENLTYWFPKGNIGKLRAKNEQKEQIRRDCCVYDEKTHLKID